MLSLSRWTGRVKETLKTKRRKHAPTTTTNDQKNNDNIGKTNGSDQQQQPMRAATHNGSDDNDGRNPGADKTEAKRSNNKNKIKGLGFLYFFTQQQKKNKPEAVQEAEGQEGGGVGKRDKDKHDSRDENDGSSRWKGRGRGMKWGTNKKKGSAAHNSRDTISTTTTAATATDTATTAYAYAKHQQQQQQDDMPRNEDEGESTNMKSDTARGVGATGTRAAEEKSDARALTLVYRFRTLDVFPRSFRHPLNDHHYENPSITPTLPRTTAVAPSSSVTSFASSYNAKADDNNNNALEATTITTTTTRPRDYYYRHRLRRVLSVEFIHDIEADTIDVPWSSSSPPSPLLTQSPLSQQHLNNKHEHETEIEIEHELGLPEQHQHPDDLTAAPAPAAPAHAPPIPLRPALTHRPPYEPNPIQIHHDFVVHHQGFSILDDIEDDATIILEREGPTVQDDNDYDDDDDVSVTLDVARATAKTEIDALWTTHSCSSSSSSLSLPLTSKTSAPNLDRVPLPFLPLRPVMFVSTAQGPRRGLEPSNQSAVSLTKVHQAAPISGTEGGRITSNTEKEREEGEGVCLFSSPFLLPVPAVSSQDERRENIFSRRFISECQEQPSSLFQHSLSSSHSHSPTCQLQQQQQGYLDQGHQQDPCGLIISHTDINDFDNDNSLNHSHGDQHQHQHLQQSRLWSVLPYTLEVEAALDECLSDIYHFTSSAPNSFTNSHHHHNRYSTITTSQDDNKSAYQVSIDQGQGWDAYLDYDRQSPPLPTPPVLKDAVATTTVTTAFADAVLDQDKPASSPQQLYQQLLSSSAPPTGTPPLPERSSSSDEESTESLMIAPLLPPPVAILVLDQKDDICAEVAEDLDSKDIPRPLLPGQHQDGIEQQKQQEPTITTTIKRVSTTDVVVDKSFLNGLFAGTLTWWTKPTPTPAPVPPITITTSAMASTTSPILRRMNQGRGRPAQSGDLDDMDPFWDF